MSRSYRIAAPLSTMNGPTQKITKPCYIAIKWQHFYITDQQLLHIYLEDIDPLVDPPWV